MTLICPGDFYACMRLVPLLGMITMFSHHLIRRIVNSVDSKCKYTYCLQSVRDKQHQSTPSDAGSDY